jgi:hypothetical protein
MDALPGVETGPQGKSHRYFSSRSGIPGKPPLHGKSSTSGKLQILTFPFFNQYSRLWPAVLMNCGKGLFRISSPYQHICMLAKKLPDSDVT